MAFITSPRVKELVKKIATKEVTIAEFFETAKELAASKGVINKLDGALNTLRRAGIDVDTVKWDDFTTRKNVKKLLDNEVTKENTFIQISSAEGKVKEFFANNSVLVEGFENASYPFADPNKQIGQKTGLAAIFTASLELTKEGVVNLMQKKLFDDILIRTASHTP